MFIFSFVLFFQFQHNLVNVFCVLPLSLCYQTNVNLVSASFLCLCFVSVLFFFVRFCCFTFQCSANKMTTTGQAMTNNRPCVASHWNANGKTRSCDKTWWFKRSQESQQRWRKKNKIKSLKSGNGWWPQCGRRQWERITCTQFCATRFWTEYSFLLWTTFIYSTRWFADTLVCVRPGPSNQTIEWNKLYLFTFVSEIYFHFDLSGRFGHRQRHHHKSFVCICIFTTITSGRFLFRKVSALSSDYFD